MSTKIVVPSSVTPRMTQGRNIFKGIHPYDGDNHYPQRMDNAYASSGQASTCVDLLGTFLVGQGFLNKEIENLVVNDKGETLGKIHKLVCKDRAKFTGFCIHISWSPLFEINSIRHIPLKTIRIGLPVEGKLQKLIYNPDWKGENDAYKADKDVKFDIYTSDPLKIIDQITEAGGYDKWKGQILYFSEEGDLIYPKAVADAVIEDVLTDRGIKTFKYRGVENGFLPDGMLITIGKMEDEEKEQFDQNLTQYQGADRSHKMIHVNAESKEVAPTWVPFADDQKDKKYEYTESSVKENIIGAFQQPLILHAINIAGSLGSSKAAIDEAKTVYDERTRNSRDNVAKVLCSILEFWHEGNPSKDLDYSVIPVTGIASKAQVKPLAERIGVGGMTSLQAILMSAMEPPAKVNVLIIAFGLSAQEADAMVNGTTIQTNEPT